MLSSSAQNNRRHSLRLGLSSLAIATLVFGALACQPQGQGPQAAVDTTAIKGEIDSLRSAYEKAYAAGDFETIMSVPHPDMIYSPPGRPPIRSRDSVVAYEQEMRPPGATIDLEPIDLRVLSAEWVYEMGIGTITFTPEEAEEPRTMESTYLAIFRKTPGGWKTYRESISSNGSSPGAE